MGYPMFHGAHWNSINLVPKLNLLVYKVLISNKGAFEFYFPRKYDRFRYILEVKIPGLDHSIQQTIIYKVISHRLSNNDFNVFIELSKEKYFDDMIKSIFFYYLLHHELIFSLNFSMAIYNTINILGSSPSSFNGIETIAARSEMKDRLAINLVSIAFDCL